MQESTDVRVQMDDVLRAALHRTPLHKPLLITPEMVEAAYRAQRAAYLEATEDDRVPITPATRARMKACGLHFDVPPDPKTVIMLDEIEHTVQFPQQGNPSCICYPLEKAQIDAATTPKRRRRARRLIGRNYEDELRRSTAPLGGNTGFQLMR